MNADRARLVALAGLAALSSAPCEAHLKNTGLGPIYDGIGHFVLTPEDLIPAVALALLVGLQGKDHARRMIFLLPLAWLAGGIAGLITGAPPPAALAWLPILALGGLAAADLRLPLAAISALAVLLGAFLGYANGATMAQTGGGWRAIAGIAAAVFVVTTLVAACVAAWQAGWLRIAWRVAGSWIAAGGLLLLGWSLR
jgi:urease accessory protein